MIRFSWLLTRSLRDLTSFKISSSLASDFCGRHKRRVRLFGVFVHILVAILLRPPLLWNKHTTTVTMSNLRYVTIVHFLCYLQSWTIYAMWHSPVIWGLTCFASAGAQWAVITEQNCRETHGLGPRRVAVLWVRCGRTPSSSRRPEQQQTPQFVGQSGLNNKPPHEDSQQSALLRTHTICLLNTVNPGEAATQRWAAIMTDNAVKYMSINCSSSSILIMCEGLFGGVHKTFS